MRASGARQQVHEVGHCTPSPITLTGHSVEPWIVQLDGQSYRISHEQSPGSAALVMQ